MDKSDYLELKWAILCITVWLSFLIIFSTIYIHDNGNRETKKEISKN